MVLVFVPLNSEINSYGSSFWVCYVAKSMAIVLVFGSVT